MNAVRENIEKNLRFIVTAQKMISCFRRQSHFEAFDLAKEAINQMDSIITELSQKKDNMFASDIFNFPYIMEMLSNLLVAQERKDYILLADLYEIQVIPHFIKIQENLCSLEELTWNDIQYKKNSKMLQGKYPKLSELLRTQKQPVQLHNQEYMVEYTSSGAITLATVLPEGKKYMHSNYIPQCEANDIATGWYDRDKNQYAILGLGMGYHVHALAEMSEYISIKVYESDIAMIQIACAYSQAWEVLCQPNVEIIYEPDEKVLLQKLFKNNKHTMIGIHYPTMIKLKNKEVRESLEDFFIQDDAYKRYRYALDGNFMANVARDYETIDVLESKFRGKSLYIVAAGPSLDKNFMELKKVGENGVILATGTVFRKLVNAGIYPDYVIGIDATKLIHRQIEGLENLNIPLIGLSTVYKSFMQDYSGEKYIVYQSGYKKAEQVAKEKGYKLYQTGGSVSTLALDIGIHFTCKKVIFLGLDLAYPNGMKHATGTDFVDVMNTEFMDEIEDIYGNLVYTSKNMNIYRKWIEQRIKQINNIEFIDATEGGAKIAGMKILKMTEVIRDKVS